MNLKRNETCYLENVSNLSKLSVLNFKDLSHSESFERCFLYSKYVDFEQKIIQLVLFGK